MKNFDFLSSLGSWAGSHSSVTLASTVGSPSAHRRGTMLRLISVLVLIFTFGVGNVWGATETIYQETFGTPTGNTNVTDYSGWSASSITYGGSAKVGVTAANICGRTGSSESGYVYMSNANIKQLDISGINTSGYTSIQLSYNYKGGSTSARFSIEYSTDGTTYTALSSNNSCTTTWQGKTESTSLPATSNLRLRITNTATSYSVFFDDLIITGTAAAIVAVSSVSVNPTSKAIVVGETFTVTPTVLPNNATNKNINWSSSATDKATVTSAGLVTGVAAGSANIKATSAADANKNATCAVSIYSVTVEKYDEGGVEITDAGVTASCSVKTLSQNVGSTDYKFKEWQVTAGGMSVSSNTLTGTPTGNVTVRAVFYKPISVTWIVDGEPWNYGGSTTAKYDGKVANLPTAPTKDDGCGDKFMGWTSNNIGEAVLDKTDDAATISTLNCFTDAEHSPVIQDATIFYAVFAEYVEK